MGEAEIEAVVECLRSGWLTTGQRTTEFESRFAEYVGTRYAVAVNSCTAALHLALEAIGLKSGELVLVPTFTFAATAEVVRYFDAIPVFVDSDPETLCICPEALERTLAALANGEPVAGVSLPYGVVRAVIPVHYAGQVAEMAPIRAIADRYGLALIGDAAHTLPAYYRSNSQSPWQSVGTLADITCFSFYANKCITTGEGGMIVTDREDFADRMRLMSLHGMSKDAWKRFSGEGSWYYEILAPGFKYNLTDIAASIGLRQLDRAETLLSQRREIAGFFSQRLATVEELETPIALTNRQHAWHLYVIRLRLERLSIDRARFIAELAERGVSASVHWLPLHMHPYYRDTFHYAQNDFPVAAAAWERIVSLPIFPGMTIAEREFVVQTVMEVTRKYHRGG